MKAAVLFFGVALVEIVVAVKFSHLMSPLSMFSSGFVTGVGVTGGVVLIALSKKGG